MTESPLQRYTKDALVYTIMFFVVCAIELGKLYQRVSR